MTARLAAALAALIAGGPAFASDAVQGVETTFTSPNGVVERCVRIAPIPAGTLCWNTRPNRGRTPSNFRQTADCVKLA